MFNHIIEQALTIVFLIITAPRAMSIHILEVKGMLIQIGFQAHLVMRLPVNHSEAMRLDQVAHSEMAIRMVVTYLGIDMFIILPSTQGGINVRVFIFALLPPLFLKDCISSEKYYQ
jgi:hypothetical protein